MTIPSQDSRSGFQGNFWSDFVFQLQNVIFECETFTGSDTQVCLIILECQELSRKGSHFVLVTCTRIFDVEYWADSFVSGELLSPFGYVELNGGNVRW